MNFTKISFVLGLIFLVNFPKGYTQISIVCFYNCENFYDTVDQQNVIDEDFLPTSERGYTQSIYNAKTKNIATVIYKMGLLANSNGISLMGLAEIENKMVLTKLMNEPIIKKYHYKYIHFDSKDPRGVDVALIYNPVHFIPYQYKPINLTNDKYFTKYATRDILFVKGLLENEWVYIFVNHWPSRRGGLTSSQNKRIWASTVCKKIMDSIVKENAAAKFILMGDFNDNPTNKSLKMLHMMNPFLTLFKKGYGSLAFNDNWNLFDQILLSPNWMKSIKDNEEKFSLTNYKPVIYKNFTMIEKNGKYKGYPKRTYNGIEYNGGYSDHFPVALIFTLKKDTNSP